MNILPFPKPRQVYLRTSDDVTGPFEAIGTSYHFTHRGDPLRGQTYVLFAGEPVSAPMASVLWSKVEADAARAEIEASRPPKPQPGELTADEIGATFALKPRAGRNKAPVVASTSYNSGARECL